VVAGAVVIVDRGNDVKGTTTARVVVGAAAVVVVVAEAPLVAGAFLRALALPPERTFLFPAFFPAFFFPAFFPAWTFFPL
jgi:hypothetical protein